MSDEERNEDRAQQALGMKKKKVHTLVLPVTISFDVKTRIRVKAYDEEGAVKVLKEAEPPTLVNWVIDQLGKLIPDGYRYGGDTQAHLITRYHVAKAIHKALKETEKFVCIDIEPGTSGHELEQGGKNGDSD